MVVDGAGGDSTVSRVLVCKPEIPGIRVQAACGTTRQKTDKTSGLLSNTDMGYQKVRACGVALWREPEATPPPPRGPSGAAQHPPVGDGADGAQAEENGAGNKGNSRDIQRSQ